MAQAPSILPRSCLVVIFNLWWTLGVTTNPRTWVGDTKEHGAAAPESADHFLAKHLRTSFGTLKGQIDRTMSCMKDYSEAQQFAASSAEVESKPRSFDLYCNICSPHFSESIHHRNGTSSVNLGHMGDHTHPGAVQGRYFELQLAETNEQTSFREGKYSVFNDVDLL